MLPRETGCMAEEARNILIEAANEVIGKKKKRNRP